LSLLLSLASYWVVILLNKEMKTRLIEFCFISYLRFTFWHFDFFLEFSRLDFDGSFLILKLIFIVLEILRIPFWNLEFFSIFRSSYLLDF
jgi:hypothetical protein